MSAATARVVRDGEGRGPRPAPHRFRPLDGRGINGSAARTLPDGRLHLQHGPIDLIVGAWGARVAVAAAFRSAADRFDLILRELCGELDALRRPAHPADPPLDGSVARCMQAAVRPFAADAFITPMAAVAGAVAEDVLAAMTRAAPLDRAFVNNGGDIALHLARSATLAVGLVDRPDRPSLFGRLRVRGTDGSRGIATSGWRGCSFSLGIADAVTILARTAAEADAAATVIANAVDLPGHPAVRRVPARDVQADSDLGDRLVTREVGSLSEPETAAALRAGVARALDLLGRGLIAGAALHLQGVTEVVCGSASLFEGRPGPAGPSLPRATGEEPSRGASRDA